MTSSTTRRSRRSRSISTAEVFHPPRCMCRSTALGMPSWSRLSPRSRSLRLDYLAPDSGAVHYMAGGRATCGEELECSRSGQRSTVPIVASDQFVPVGFAAPTTLTTDQFRLEPLGSEHNQADHAAWTSSIGHIRSTPGYPDGNWPPPDGMTLEENLADLRRHADHFTRGIGFTFTVLDPRDGDVIGCVYLYPSASIEWDVTVQSWVRADRAALDVPLADAVARWVATDWPWDRVDRCGR